MALVAALGLLILGAALLAGSAAASLSLGRASRTLSAASRAEAESRRALVLVLQGWDAELDSMPVGRTVDRAVVPGATDGDPVRVHASVRRVGQRVFAVTSTVEVGDSTAIVAMRRMRLMVERSVDTTAVGAHRPVVPITRWSLVDLP